MTSTVMSEMALRAKQGMAKLLDASADANREDEPAHISLQPAPLRSVIAKCTRTNDHLTDPRFVQAQLDVVDFVDKHTDFVEQRIGKLANSAEVAMQVAKAIIVTDATAFRKATVESSNSLNYLSMGCRMSVTTPTAESEAEAPRRRLVANKDWKAVPEDPEVVQAALLAMEGEREAWYRRIARLVN